jgi:hypothetical protein
MRLAQIVLILTVVSTMFLMWLEHATKIPH